LLDRIDLVCEVDAVPTLELVRNAGPGRTSSAVVRERVVTARARQRARLAGTGVLCNGDMDGRLTRRQVPVDPMVAARLLAVRDRMGLSGRGHDRVLRVARTIADLAGRLGAGGGVMHLRPVEPDDAGVDRERTARACDRCLRRAHLVGYLAPRIAGLLDRRESRVSGLLALRDEALIAAAVGRRDEDVYAFLDSFDPDAAREELDRAGVTAVCRHTRLYPPRLTELADPPAVLFALGRLQALETLREEPSVAVVGTRRPTPYGTEVAHSLGRGLGAAGVPVISGLALGIDATAHDGCLDGRGLPVAVLACGPDVVYPRRHRRLHERVRRAGVVLSEMPPGQTAFRWSFPARNRIMAGLATMTVVVEAASPSGSLITADVAHDLGRAVAAVPGRVTTQLAKGTNELLRDGAVPITRAEDILDELFGVEVRRVRLPPEPPSEPEDPTLKAVLGAVEAGRTADAISTATGLSAGDVRAALGRLETEGFVVRRDLGGWERALG
jgi:DNA processing protein